MEVGSDTVRKLGSWLGVHIRDTGVSVERIARELGVGSGTVRAWLTGGAPEAADDNEYAHLDTPVKLGTWLRALIKDAGCSVRDLALSTNGVSMGTVYNWLKGEHLPPPPVGDEPDRFDLLLSNPLLGLGLTQRVQLDEIRRRLTGTSFYTRESASGWLGRALPAAVDSFTGRAIETRRLDRILRDHVRGSAVVITALTGIGGVGKTALAVQWARSRDSRATFPDGCVYIDLNGFSDTAPVTPEAALTRMLHQLDVDIRSLPVDLVALAAIYHKTLANRRLMLVLDNAQNEPQVRHLLPTAPGCLAVITSRNQLVGLDVTVGGLTRIRLDVLVKKEAVSLVRNLLGTLATRSTTDEEVEAFAEACGHLPLAIQIAAANYLTHAHPHGVMVGAYTERLKADQLGSLAIGPGDPGTAVAATLDRSYQNLSGPARRMYRLLGLHPGPHFTVAAAASLVGAVPDEARTGLVELARANLLAHTGPGRYGFHDLVREHARRLAETAESDEERVLASRRLLDHHLHAAHAAARLLSPTLNPMGIALVEASAGTVLETHTDADGAMDWLTSEAPVLLNVVDLAATAGLDTQVWQLGWSLFDFFDRRGLWREQVATQRAALRAAVRLANVDAQTHTHRNLAHAHMRLTRFEEAADHLSQAAELHRGARNPSQQAQTLYTLSYVSERRGRPAEAIEYAGEAFDLYREAGDIEGQARALNGVGWLHAQLGDFEPALTCCERGLALYRDLDDETGVAAASDSLGYIHHHLGNHSEAIAFYGQALELFRSAGDRYNEADTLTNLGETHRATGNPAEARDTWRLALAILDDLGHPDAAGLRERIDGGRST